MKVMTHVIAGFPTLDETYDLAVRMSNIGVDYIEVQIPFNDPIGDGPTIVEASNISLNSGTDTKKSFELIERIILSVDTPIFIMTYANIALNIGYESFVQKAKEIGVSGVIIPDMPIDGEDEFWQSLKRHDLPIIPVVSPTNNISNLDVWNNLPSFMIYSTLRVGTTGTSTTEIPKEYLKSIKNIFKDKLIATGFGIDSVEKLDMLQGYSDVAVIGSEVIRILKKDGIEEVETFLKKIVKKAHSI